MIDIRKETTQSITPTLWTCQWRTSYSSMDCDSDDERSSDDDGNNRETKVPMPWAFREPWAKARARARAALSSPKSKCTAKGLSYLHSQPDPFLTVDRIRDSLRLGKYTKDCDHPLLEALLRQKIRQLEISLPRWSSTAALASWALLGAVWNSENARWSADSQGTILVSITSHIVCVLGINSVCHSS